MRKASAHEVETMMAKTPNMIVINVLPVEEYVQEHIPRSINVPFDAPDFLRQVERRVKDKKAPVVVYCASERCDVSSRAGHALERGGYTNVIHFHGGMEEWLESGRRAESKKRRAA